MMWCCRGVEERLNGRANPLSHKDYHVSQGVEYPSCRTNAAERVMDSLLEPLLQRVSE